MAAMDPRTLEDFAKLRHYDPKTVKAWQAATTARERAGESPQEALAGGWADAVANAMEPGGRLSWPHMERALAAMSTHPMSIDREDGRQVILHGLIPMSGLTEPEVDALAQAVGGTVRKTWGAVEVILLRARPTRPLSESDAHRIEAIARRRLRARLPGSPLARVTGWLAWLAWPADEWFLAGL